MIEISELSMELVSGPGLGGKLGVLERNLTRRMAEIARILEDFPEEKTRIFPDVLWKTACAIEDVLRGAVELGEEQPRGQSLAFLGFVFASFDAVEPEPIPKSWGLAGLGLCCAVDFFDDGQTEVCFNVIKLVIARLQDLKRELRSPRENARAELLLAQAARTVR